MYKNIEEEISSVLMTQNKKKKRNKFKTVYRK